MGTAPAMDTGHGTEDGDGVAGTRESQQAVHRLSGGAAQAGTRALALPSERPEALCGPTQGQLSGPSVFRALSPPSVRLSSGRVTCPRRPCITNVVIAERW